MKHSLSYLWPCFKTPCWELGTVDAPTSSDGCWKFCHIPGWVGVDGAWRYVLFVGKWLRVTVLYLLFVIVVRTH